MRLPKIPTFVMTSTISIFGKVKIDVDGQKVVSNPVDYKCRKEAYDRQKYNKLGDQPDYSWVVYLNDDIDVTTDSNCQLDGQDFIIKDIDKHYNPDSTFNHMKLYLL